MLRRWIGCVEQRIIVQSERAKKREKQTKQCPFQWQNIKQWLCTQSLWSLGTCVKRWYLDHVIHIHAVHACVVSLVLSDVPTLLFIISGWNLAITDSGLPSSSCLSSRGWISCTFVVKYLVNIQYHTMLAARFKHLSWILLSWPVGVNWCQTSLYV